jgi:hypothetical protein
VCSKAAQFDVGNNSRNLRHTCNCKSVVGSLLNKTEADKLGGTAAAAVVVAAAGCCSGAIAGNDASHDGDASPPPFTVPFAAASSGGCGCVGGVAGWERLGGIRSGAL